MSGKWHVASQPDHSRPTPGRMQRGFDEFFGTIIGAGSFYDPNTLTRGNENIEHEAKRRCRISSTPTRSATRRVAFIDEASPGRRPIRRSSPTSPTPRRTGHCTRTTRTSRNTRAVSTRAGISCAQARLDKLVEWGILDAAWKLTDRDPTQPPWTGGRTEGMARCAAWRSTRRRSIAWTRASAASSTRSSETGQLDDTLIIFLSDNGACAEDIPEDVTVDELVDKLMIARSHDTRAASPCISATTPGVCPGPENTYQSYGTAWANLSNTPFRLYKHWIHEGGISTPLIAALAERHSRSAAALRHAPGYLPDIMATIVDVAGATYPDDFRRPTRRAARRPVARAGVRAAARWTGRPMFWEHEGNAAVRIGNWKLVQQLSRCVGAATTWMPTAPSCTTSPPQHPGARRRHGGAIRRLGKALRRHPARESRRADEGPGRDARILGEGRDLNAHRAGLA